MEGQLAAACSVRVPAPTTMGTTRASDPSTSAPEELSAWAYEVTVAPAQACHLSTGEAGVGNY